MANPRIEWFVRTPPGINQKGGFPIVPIFSPGARNAQDLLRVFNEARRAFPMGRVHQIGIYTPTEGGLIPLPILAEDLRDVRSMEQVIARFLGQVEGVQGSDTFLTEGEPAPVPDFTTFDIWFTGINLRDLNNANANANPIPRINIPRVPRNALNPRGLGNDPKYGFAKSPWMFKAEDGSHDPWTFEDDGLCLRRVLDHLGMDDVPIPPMTPKEHIRWLRQIYRERNPEDKPLHIVNVHEELSYWIDYTRHLPDEQVLKYFIHKSKRKPLRICKVTQYMVTPLDPNAHYVLFDGESHVAVPLMDRSYVDGPRFKLTENFFHREGDFFHVFPSRRADVDTPPWVDTTKNPIWQTRQLADNWKCVRAYPVETDRRRREQQDPMNHAYAYCAWDLETVNTLDGHTVPYAISWLFVDVELDHEGYPILPTDFTGFKDKTEFRFGPDCVEEFIDLILERTLHTENHKAYKEVVGVTFNGASFDHLLLFESFMAKPRQAYNSMFYGDFSLDREFFQGSRLTSLVIENYFHLFDLRNHLPGSLAANCSAFRCENKKEGDFDHEAVQRVFEREGFEGLRTYRGPDLLPVGETPDMYPDGNYPLFMEKLESYAKLDSAALLELFFRYRGAKIFPRKPRSDDFPGPYLMPPLTNASESYQAWVEHSKDLTELVQHIKPETERLSNEDFRMVVKKWKGKVLTDKNGDVRYERLRIASIHDPLPLHVLEELRKHVVAGRTQLFHPPAWVKEPVVSMDVKSLYPYVMCVKDVDYPAGEVTAHNGTHEEIYAKYRESGLLGLWLVDVDQAHLEAQNLPKILASKIPYELDELAELYGIPAPKIERNDWHADIVRRTWVTNEEIRVLLKFGCTVYFRECILFSGRIRSVDLFGNLSHLMKIKNGEDRKKEADKKLPKGAPKTANPALRQTAKLASNSIFGKMLESFHLSTLIPMNLQKYENISGDIKREKAQYESMSVLYSFGNRVYARVKKNPLHDALLKKQHPAQVGFYILAYARMYMYEYAYAPLGLDNCLYTDTDAIKTTRRAFEEKLKPLWSAEEIPHWKSCEQFEPLYRQDKIYEKKCRCYGGFEDEFDEEEYHFGDNGGLVTIAKKLWLLVPRGVEELMIENPDSPCADDQTYVKISHKEAKCGMKGVGEKDILLTEAQAEFLCSNMFVAGSFEWRKRCEALFSDKTRMVRHCLGELFARLLYFKRAYILRSNFVKAMSQHTQGVRWEQEDKHLKEFSSLRQRFSVAILDPGKNQEVQEAVPEHIAFG